MTEATMIVGGREIRYIVEDDDRESIDRAEQIPPFASEADEQAWWQTHALSERFWREAPAVPADKLPPIRADPDDSERRSGTPDQGNRVGPSGSQVVAGIVLSGLLVAGAAYVLYALFKGRSAPAGFLPTGISYLSVSPPRAALVASGLANASHLARIR